VMVYIQADLSQAISVVRKYMLGKEHCNAVKWILRYLRGTSDVGLILDEDTSMDCIATRYVDSDFAGDLDRHRSTASCVFTLVGGPISWRSML